MPLQEPLAQNHFFKIVHDAGKGRLDARSAKAAPYGQGVGAQKKEAIGLFLVQDFLDAGIDAGALRARLLRAWSGLLPAATTSISAFWYQTKFRPPSWAQAWRMPDLENVGILGNGPAQDDGVKLPLWTNSRVKAAHSTVRMCASTPILASWLLNQRGRKNALLIALVGQDGEGQRAAFFLRRPFFFFFSRKPASSSICSAFATSWATGCRLWMIGP